jgi:hypothetical protein
VRLRATVVALAAVVLGLTQATVNATTSAGRPLKAGDAGPPPRVTLITDSVGGVLFWVTDARAELAQGLDLRLETRTCRKLIAVGCYAYGETPPSALETIQTLGAELGPLVVVDVGYNDRPDEYAAGLDTVMQALVDAGVQHVIWVTLEETEDVWVANNAIIRDAPTRWPQLVVADWAPVAAANPSWFVDAAHMNADGAFGFARFLRPIILATCGPPCEPPAPVPPPAPVTPLATMLPPTIGTRVAVIRWRGNEDAATFDLAVKRGRGSWRTLASRLAATSYRLRGSRGEQVQARVRARDAAGRPGPWSTSRRIRFKTP